jgi:hypothetical protein
LQIKDISIYSPNNQGYFFTFFQFFLQFRFCVRTQGEENEQKMHTNPKTTVSKALVDE